MTANSHRRCAHALGLCEHPEDLRYAAGDNMVVRPTDVRQHVPASRIEAGELRLLEAERVAELAGDHLWTAITAYLITEPEAYLDAEEGNLDAENLVSANVGCYRCEEPLTRELLTRRCPGEPRR